MPKIPDFEKRLSTGRLSCVVHVCGSIAFALGSIGNAK